MDFKYIDTPLLIRLSHIDGPVKPPRTTQRLIKHLRPIGCRQNNNRFTVIKTIHLCQKLIQCLLPFVIASELIIPALTNGVNLINKNNAWSLYLRLFKQIADTGSAHTNEHLDKIRTGQREKRYSGFSGYRLGKQCLTCSRRTDKQCSFRKLCSDFPVFLRMIQIIYNLHQRFLGLILSGHILERHLRSFSHIFLGTAFSHAAKAAHTAHGPHAFCCLPGQG